jgi:hypothetical protein
MRQIALLLLGALVACGLAIAGCDDDRRDVTPGGGDTDMDGDGDTDTGPTGPIPQDCSECVGVGTEMENRLCAFDICDSNLVLGAEYTSPTASPTETTYAAVEHFGDVTNGLTPKLNGSYTLQATGPAVGTEHTEDLGGNPGSDPYANDEYADTPTYNEMEWRITLEAPDEAHGFGFKYVFFSEEYDEFISTQYNDKFYVFLEAGSTNGGEKSIINFTHCRSPDEYYDFECEAGQTGCEQGERYCYIAINSAMSDCCWFNGCPDGFSWEVGTDIAGTGFACSGSDMDGSQYGSSTGWLQTTWPIEPGEQFAITFHIHDTGDGILDSEVILDAFEFMYDSTVPETVEVE